MERKFYIPPEGSRLDITAEMLRRDNESPEARARILRWNENRSSNGIFVVGMCADSRGIPPNPEEITVLRSIAVGSINEPAYQQRIYNYPGVRGIILIPHFAGPINPGLTPEGCGGAKERRNLEGQNENFPENSIEWWIKEKLMSYDVIVQSCILGQEIAKQSGKSVLVAPQNHLDGTITPVAFVTSDGILIADSPIIQFCSDKQYDPSTIYEFGLPELPLSARDHRDYEDYENFLNQYKAQLSAINDKYPNLKKMQEKQSPNAIFLSTEIRPFEVRFPSLTDRPGDIFKLHIPQIKIDPQTTQTTLEDLDAILCQIKYPIDHFKNINTIYIETNLMSESIHLARQLMQEPWMEDPIQSGRVKIIVGQVNKEGIIESIFTLNS